MEDFLIIEYLKDKGIYNLTDEEFKEKFKDMFHKYFKEGYSLSKVLLENKHKEDTYKSKHLTEEEAIDVVSNMYHYSNGNKYSGEAFTMLKALEVYNSYKSCIYGNVPVSDVYIAINALYHDYIDLYKEWFNDLIEPKIIESAIVFWFRDDDYTDGSKVYNYFHKW